MFVALAYYGLDEVGAELEQPFGIDEADIPLLKMGDGLANDLDCLLRTANKSRIDARMARSRGAGVTKVRLGVTPPMHSLHTVPQGEWKSFLSQRRASKLPNTGLASVDRCGPPQPPPPSQATRPRAARV